MGQMHRFTSIRRYRIRKFDQYKVGGLPYQGSELHERICVGACFMWINNKLTKPNRLENLFGRKPWSDMFAEQEGEEGKADVDYRLFLQGNELTRPYLNTASGMFDLRPVAKMLPNIKAVRTMVRASASSAPAAERIVRDLPKGHAALIGFRYADVNDGHAVAAYRSRGDNLYFFDPGTGVYAFTSTEALHFFVQWAANYRNTRDAVQVDPRSGFVFSTYTRN